MLCLTMEFKLDYFSVVGCLPAVLMKILDQFGHSSGLPSHFLIFGFGRSLLFDTQFYSKAVLLEVTHSSTNDE